MVLASPGSPFDQQMAVGQQCDEQAVQQRLLADDLALQLAAQSGEGLLRRRGGRIGRVNLLGGCTGHVTMLLLPESD